MLQLAFDIAQWLVWVAGAVAVAALLVVVGRLVRRPRRLALRSAAAFVVATGVCVASVVFLGTRVQQVTIGTISQLGLEKDHAGLRGNALSLGRKGTTPSASSNTGRPDQKNAAVYGKSRAACWTGSIEILIIFV